MEVCQKNEGEKLKIEFPCSQLLDVNALIYDWMSNLWMKRVFFLLPNDLESEQIVHKLEINDVINVTKPEVTLS